MHSNKQENNQYSIALIIVPYMKPNFCDILIPADKSCYIRNNLHLTSSRGY